MIRFWLPLAGLSLLFLAGCRERGAYKPADIHYADQGRSDAGYGQVTEFDRLSHTDLNFDDADVDKVVGVMEDKFSCRIDYSKAARAFITESNPRINARVESIPENLAFAVARSLLETKGLVLVAKKNPFGKPGFLLDRSAVRDLSAAPAASAGGAGR